MAFEEKYMNMALETARYGITHGYGGPFGCVIVRKSDGKVLANTHNTVISSNDPTAHGEINAIRQACAQIKNFKLEDCELYTTSEPCPMCMCAIMWARIPSVYYAQSIEDAAKIGFDDKPFYEEIVSYNSDKTTRFVKVESVKSSDSQKLFDDYTNMEHVAY